MRSDLFVAVVVGLTANVAADSSVPTPPVPDDNSATEWQLHCRHRLQRAQRNLVREEPDFSSGAVVIEKKPRAVRWEAVVSDRRMMSRLRSA